MARRDPRATSALPREAPTLERIDGLEGAERLGDAWRGLEPLLPDRTVFGSYDYALAWYRWYGPRRGTPLVAAVWSGDSLLALAPFAIWSGTLGKVPLRRADLAGYTCGAGELLVPPEMPELTERLLDAVWQRRGIDLVCLSGFAPDSPKLNAVLEAAARRGWRAECEPYEYASVDLRGGYEAYGASMSRNFRRTVKRLEQRITAGGGGRVDRLRGPAAPAEIEEYVRRMVGIADRSWKARRGGPMAPEHRGFYRELALRFARRGMLDLSILRIGGIDAAFLLALVEGGVWYDVTISFDDAFSEYSPGAHLMLQNLQTLPQLGVHTVVSHGAHEYKNRWASGFVPQIRVFLFAPGLRGRLSRLARFVAPRALSRLRGRAPRAGV